MDRLTCLITLCTASVCISVCNGQEVSPYTIAGDVRAPGNHFFEGWQQVQLADLLHRAHPLSESGNAVILRGQPLAVVTSINVQPNQPIRQTSLQPGDIVMFRRFEGGPTGDGTAVVGFGQVPTVVSLPGGPLPLFEVLEALQIQTSQPVSLVRAAWGELQFSQLKQNDLVQHGDVLDLTVAADEQHFVQLPVASEATSHFSGVLNHANLSRTVSPGEHSNTTNSAIEVTEQSDVFLESTSDARMPSLILPGLNVSDSASHSEAAQDTTTFVSSPLTLPEAGNEPESELAVDDRGSSNIEKSFRNASLQQTAESVEPLNAQDRTSPAAAKSASSGVWNGIFIVGLLMAMALIVAGWIKTAQERRMEDQEYDVPLAQNQAGPIFTSSPSTTSIHDGNPTADMWQSEIFSAPITVHSQDAETALDIPPEVEASGDHVMFADNEIDASEIAEILSAPESQTAAASTATNSVVLDDQPQVEKSSVSVDHANIVSEPVAGTEDVMASADDPLDDLIHNRLPLQLNQAQLPLQIALFGRPDGPRRLRIDAAHTQLAPPHMSSVERQSRRREPVRTSQPATSQRGSHDHSELSSPHTSPAPSRAHNETDGPALKASSAAKPRTEDVSRFDRALNFLEEQSER